MNGPASFDHRVRLVGGGNALVDLTDAILVDEYDWRPGGTNNSYAVALLPDGKAIRTVYLHRLVAGAGPGDVVDHIDGDRLNCRRGNLRIGTASQNCANRRFTASETGCRNVAYYPKKRKFKATVTKEGAVFRGPYRDNAEQAAHDADALLRGLFGEWGTYNFPQEGERGVDRPGGA